MKAYYLSIKDDDEGVTAVVFADTVKEAKKKVYSSSIVDYWSGEWIYLRANRAKEYDGMENLTPAQLAKEQWRNGWRWFDMAYPDLDTATDEEFIKWYDNNFGSN